MDKIVYYIPINMLDLHSTMRRRILASKLMKGYRFFGLVLFALASTVANSQQLTIESGLGMQTILTRADIEGLPRVKQPTIAGTFEGVSLKAVLEKAGVTFGETLRGKRMASYLLLDGTDGYRVVIALPELDPAFSNKEITLALLKDGKPLDEKEGPHRIVIPRKKRMARWVKRVTDCGRAVSDSVSFNHYLCGFDDGGDSVALLELELIGATAGDDAFD